MINKCLCKAKVIRIFLVPHVEVRIHVSKEMEEDYKKMPPLRRNV